MAAAVCAAYVAWGIGEKTVRTARTLADEIILNDKENKWKRNDRLENKGQSWMKHDLKI
jgi:hypothetical protein